MKVSKKILSSILLLAISSTAFSEDNPLPYPSMYAPKPKKSIEEKQLDELIRQRKILEEMEREQRWDRILDSLRR